MGGHEDDGLDVHEAGYSRETGAAPVSDTGIHASDLDLAAAHPAARREAEHSELLPGLRKAVRSTEEVQAERDLAAAEAARRRRLPIVVAAVLGTMSCGGVAFVALLVWLLWPRAADEGPTEHDGVPVRERLGD